MEKIFIRQILDEGRAYDLEGNVKLLVERLNMIAEEHPQAAIEFNTYDDYDSSICEFTIYVRRLETDDEFNQRVGKDRFREMAIREQEYQKYLVLKKKFEGE